MNSPERAAACRAASARYALKNAAKLKIKHKAYREANRAKRNAYAVVYRRRKGAKERHFLPEAMRRSKQHANASNVPYKRENCPSRAATRAAAKIIETMEQFIVCEYCESQIRRGSDEYFNGNMTELGFCCELCEGD